MGKAAMLSFMTSFKTSVVTQRNGQQTNQLSGRGLANILCMINILSFANFRQLANYPGLAPGHGLGLELVAAFF